MNDKWSEVEDTPAAGWEDLDGNAQWSEVDNTPAAPQPQAQTPAKPQMVSADQGAGFFSRLGRTYNEAVLSGFGGAFARKYHDWMDSGMDMIKKAYPNATPEELERMQEQLIADSQKDLMQQYAAEAEKDPTWRPDENWVSNLASGRWMPWLTAQVLGSVGPESLIAPGKSAVERVGGQVLLGSGSDAVYQGLEMGDGVRDGYDWKQGALAGVFGGSFQLLNELGTAGARYLKRVLSDDAPNAPSGADAPDATDAPDAPNGPNGPTQGPAPLNPEVEQGLLRIWNDPNSTPADYIAYARQNGLGVDDAQVAQNYSQRGKNGDVADASIPVKGAGSAGTDAADGVIDGSIPIEVEVTSGGVKPDAQPSLGEQHLQTPEVKENFVEPQASKSGKLVYEATADTDKNVTYYMQFRNSIDEAPVQANIMIDKATGETYINVETKNILNAGEKANTQGAAKIRDALEDILTTFPEIKSLKGDRATGARAGKEMTQVIPEKLVNKIRDRIAAREGQVDPAPVPVPEAKNKTVFAPMGQDSHSFVKETADGRRLRGFLTDRGKVVKIGNLWGFGTKGSPQNTFNLSDLREIAADIKEQFPNAEFIAGDRISGARQANNAKSKEVKVPIAALLPEGQRPKPNPVQPEPTPTPEAPPAADGLPGNGSVRPMDPAMIARIMGEPDPTITIETPNSGLPEIAAKAPEPAPAPEAQLDAEGNPIPPPTARAGNINLDRITRSDDIDALARETAANMPVDERQSREALEELAHSQDMTVDQLLAKNPKLGELPAYAVQMRNLMSQSLQNLQELARKVRSPEGSAIDRAELAKAWALHGAIQERVSLLSKTAGRLLDSFNINAKGGANYAKALKDIPNELFANPEKMDQLAEMLANANDPAVVNKIVKDAINPKAEDYIFSLWYNMMLSGPKTHVANILGNSTNFLVDLASNVGAAGIGQFRRFGKNKGDRVMFREVAARLMGSAIGAYQGIRAMPKAFKEGMPLDQVGRIESPQVIENKLLSAPTRALAAEDEFFRNVAVTSHLYGLATRKAIAEGGGVARINELLANPTKEMLEDAAQYGLRMRFQDTPGVLAQKIEQARTTMPNDSPGARAARASLRFIVPFVRTPSSLFRTAARYSPFGVGESINVKDWKAGGARADQATARVVMGSGAVALLTLWALNGEITGNGPRDVNRRKELEAGGWQANSVKIGDKYYSYKGLEPFSYLLGAVANMVEAEDRLSDKELGQVTTGLTFAMADTLTQSSWTDGLNQFFEAKASKSDSAGMNYLTNLVSSMTVPAGLRQVSQYMDEKQRVTTGDGSFEDRLAGRLKTGFPGMSETLPQAVDPYGRPITREGFAGPDFLSRIQEKTPDQDEGVRELQRLSKIDNPDTALVGPPDSTVKVGGVERKLNAEEFQNYQYLSGQYILVSVKQAMADPSWKAMSDKDKIKKVQKIKRDMRKAAREQLFSPEAAQWKEVE